MKNQPSLPFNRYDFKDIAFEVDGYDRLIRALKTRPDFPQTASIGDVMAYLRANPIRVFVLGSFYRGFNLINALSSQQTLDDDLAYANSMQDVLMLQNFHQGVVRPYVQLVGVATDKVMTDEEMAASGEKGFIGRDKRIWRYPEAMEKRMLVSDQVRDLNARGANITLYNGRVKTPEFNEFVKGLNPDIAFMGTFGQIVDQERIDLFPAGIFNFHPIGDMQWTHPLDAGPQPFEAMLARDALDCRLAMHVTNTKQDDGPLMGLSNPVPIPEGSTPPELHRLSSPYVREPLTRHLEQVFYRMALHLKNTPQARRALENHQPGLYEVREPISP